MSATKYAIRMQREQADTGRFYVGYDVILLFVIAVFINAQVLFQYFQSADVPQDVIFIGMFQLIMGIGGFSVGLAINRDVIEIAKLDPAHKDRITGTYGYGTFFAGIIIIVDMFIGMATQSQFVLQSGIANIDFNIPLTAGVVEEALFSLTLAILLYKVFKEVFKGSGMMAEPMAIMFSSAFTAVFFAMIHLYVYATALEALLMMFINRIIYTVIFLKFKNFSMIVWMHLCHNGIILAMGAL